MLLKKYSDFGGGKKNNLIQSLCHIIMLNSGEKKNILSLVLSEKNISEREKKHSHPLQVKWSVPK